ncbi:hypothetical protein F4805DRAFT_420395 [Annulohypoxylon moriforme]|nr:hypothetical protein F4805DRAFT_420395 [Annulohypoxylon moriforme]
MMSSASAAQIVSQDVVEDIVQDILDNILDEVLKDIEEEDEGHAAEIGGRVPSISFNDLAPEEEVAPFDEAALRQRIAMAIAMLDDFYKFRPKREAGAADESDAKSESDMTCSDEPTSPASTGLHSPFASDANESDTSYSEEPSCEIEELDIEDLELEETATPPHRLLENNNAASYGEIPLEHLANPEKYSNQYFRIKKSKLGGNGVFAKVDLKQGQLILVERPEIVACPESLYNELEELSPEVRNAFLRMHAHKRCPDQDHRSAILLTNA